MTLERQSTGAGVARLRVVGVGGAGGNAIRSMLRAEVRGVEFLAVNTDAQALAQVGAPESLRIGEKLTRGLGAGGDPEVGLRAAEESHDAICAALAGADMVFITAGMGGGTGTGASPVIAVAAREVGALTVGIVSTPFAFEGEPRRMAAERGLAALREQVDTLIVIPNERLLQLAGQSMRMSQAYALVDDVLRQGVQAITDLIAIPGHINLDFADVRTVMADAGSALMSIGQASGEQRAAEALRAALTNPLLDLDITGAQAVLVSVTGGPDLMIHEVSAVVEALHQKIQPGANVLFGTVEDPAYEGQIKVTLVATGFDPRVTHPARATARPAYAESVRQPAMDTPPPLAIPPAARQGLDARPERAPRAVADGLRVLPARVAGPTGARHARAEALSVAPDAWEMPHVAREPHIPNRQDDEPAQTGSRGIPPTYAEDDEPRAGPARLRPVGQPAPPAESGFAGIELPAFLRHRR